MSDSGSSYPVDRGKGILLPFMQRATSELSAEQKQPRSNSTPPLRQNEIALGLAWDDASAFVSEVPVMVRNIGHGSDQGRDLALPLEKSPVVIETTKELQALEKRGSHGKFR